MRIFGKRTARMVAEKAKASPPAPKREPLVVAQELSGPRINFAQHLGVNISGLWPGKYANSEAVQASLKRVNEEKAALHARAKAKGRYLSANEETTLQLLTRHAVWLKRQLN